MHVVISRLLTFPFCCKMNFEYYYSRKINFASKKFDTMQRAGFPNVALDLFLYLFNEMSMKSIFLNYSCYLMFFLYSETVFILHFSVPNWHSIANGIMRSEYENKQIIDSH